MSVSLNTSSKQIHSSGADSLDQQWPLAQAFKLSFFLLFFLSSSAWPGSHSEEESRTI